MGSVASRIGPQGETLPVRLRPLLRHRLEELRRRRNSCSLKASTLSKKQLLPEDNNAEHDDNSLPHSLQNRPQNSESSAEENRASLSKPPSLEENAVPSKATPLPHSPNIKGPLLPEEIVQIFHEALVIAQEDLNKAADDKKPSEEERCTKPENEDGQAAKKAREVEEEGEEEEQGERINGDEEGRYICPGSPSFRVYCMNSLANNSDDDKSDGSNSKSQNDETDTSKDSKDSKDSSVGSETKTEKKHKKGRRFRRVIPRVRPVAVKNLLNVWSCYYPTCSAHDRTHLLTEKVAV